MSVYYSWNLTKKREKDKRYNDLITALRDCSTIPELATIVNRRGTSAWNAQKGDSLGDSSSPHQDPAFSTKVTTEGLSPLSSDGRWGATSYGLMGSRTSCPGSTS
jgi:hypothetical protein